MAGGRRAEIDGRRMKTIFDAINDFGRVPDKPGWNRPGLSAEDIAVRRWFAARMQGEGLRVSMDGAANVSGRLGPEGAPCVMLGSHLDTVPSGGAFDGALGVAVALECALAMRDAEVPLVHPVEVIATSEEEGRFGGMLGSQALAGLVSEKWLETAADADGVRLTDALARHNLDPAGVMASARVAGSVKAFLELHVEQGPVLERASIPVGIADRVSGVVHLGVTLRGVANHSGTTPMDMRADAFAGLAEIATGIPGLISGQGTEQSRITIGKVELSPNFPHTIPGEALFSIIVRDAESVAMDRLCDGLHDLIAAVAGRHGLAHEIAERSRIEPVMLDAGLAGLLRKEAEALALPSVVMPSGAGHDAQTMQALAPAGLIFVPSRGGVSHAPDEWTDWEAAVAGARLMLAAAVRLACE
ncbi:Zn-dependent hydrolase [Neoaquamicrobium sediminum]|uniref:Zn-dependent hydrolase n=1 Tax=Neoaquamicrobium sediminum TaxID=1849104 RepID=UPI003BAD6E92